MIKKVILDYFRQWNLMRLLRLGLGIIIVSSGIAEQDLMFIFIGLIFTLMPIFNIGGCGLGGCATGNCEVENRSNLSSEKKTDV